MLGQAFQWCNQIQLTVIFYELINGWLLLFSASFTQPSQYLSHYSQKGDVGTKSHTDAAVTLNGIFIPIYVQIGHFWGATVGLKWWK